MPTYHDADIQRCGHAATRTHKMTSPRGQRDGFAAGSEAEAGSDGTEGFAAEIGW